MTFSELQQIPADVMPLPLAVEQKLARTLAAKRSTRKLRANAIAMLVHYSMREGFLYLGKCAKGRLSAEMLTSLAYLGLCKAAKNFKPGRLRFFSYAKIYLRSEAFRQFREGSVVRNVPREKIVGLTIGQGPQERPVDFCSRHYKPTGEGSSDFEFDKIYSRETLAALLPKIKELLTPKEYFVLTEHLVFAKNFREIGDSMGQSRSWAQILFCRSMKTVRRHRKIFRRELDL